MKKRLRNSQIIEFDETEHEIFMEKDKSRKILWNKLDEFLEI